MKIPKHRRFLKNSAKKYAQYIKTADHYLAKFNKKNQNNVSELTWAYRKPFDDHPGNQYFYEHFYALLNMLKSMNLPAGGRILEVGSGPGWVTEILMCLNFEVDALEPSADFIAVAKERLSACAAHHHLTKPPRVEFHATSLEASSLPENSFDAILFLDALHHVIDEEKCFKKCFALLKEGGILAIHEGGWVPGDIDMASKIKTEMKLYGTLENPFTTEYLDYLLVKYGFGQTTRYYSVNGLFPASQANQTLAKAAVWRANEYSNILTAVKPYSKFLTTASDAGGGKTDGKIVLVNKQINQKTRQVRLQIKLTNSGQTIWLWKQPEKGMITLALYYQEDGERIEANYRNNLPGKDVFPGEEIRLETKFTLPEKYKNKKWKIDLISENLFWFSVPLNISF